MPAETKPTEAAASAQPPKQPASQPQAYSLPQELGGKSAEEVGRYYAERYHDYDNIKSRADKFGEYEALNLRPDDIRQTVEWARGIVAPLMQGKRASWDRDGNRIVFLDGESAPAAPAAAPQNAFENWETLEPRQQAERLAEYVYGTQLTPRVNEIAQGYDTRFNQAVQQMQQQFGVFMDAIDRWTQNPNLKPRDIVAKAVELMRAGQQPTSFIDLAAQQLASPAQMEAEVQKRVAAALAEEKAKAEAEKKNAAPILDTPTGIRPRGMFASDGKKLSRNEVRSRIWDNFRANQNGQG